jgi:hypothetical protein
MPKERHRAKKKNHKHSPSKVFAHGVIKITILTTKDGPKLKHAPGLKQIVIIRTSWNRDIKPTELVHAAAAELGCEAVYNGEGGFPGHVFVNITVKSFMHVFKQVATARAPNMNFDVHIEKVDKFRKRFLAKNILTKFERVYGPDSTSESEEADDSESEAEKKKPARMQKKPKADVPADDDDDDDDDDDADEDDEDDDDDDDDDNDDDDDHDEDDDDDVRAYKHGYRPHDLQDGEVLRHSEDGRSFVARHSEDEDSDDKKKGKKAKSSRFVVNISSDDDAPAPKVKKAHNNAEASSSGDAIAAVKEAEWEDAIAANEVANANGRRASERKRKKTASRDA